MMRNEAPILNPFLDQLATFFDHIIIVDHNSADNSASIVKSRKDPRIELLHLKARGYPQSEVATAMMRRIFAHSSIDWLFFLDCDEFLPFNNRADLEGALKQNGSNGYCHLRWANIVPDALDGLDIFSAGFEYTGSLSPYPKILISRGLFERYDNLQVLQGYHACASTEILPLSVELSPAGLYHVPVTSKIRFAMKIKSSGEKVMSDKMLLAKGLGYHWVNHYLDLTTHSFESYDFRSAGLAYPGGETVGVDTETLSFKFPYITTPYEEKQSELLHLLYNDNQALFQSAYYVLQDQNGEIIDSGPGDNIDLASCTTEIVASREACTTLDRLSAGQTFSILIEPLFSLPMKLPPTAWAGHIPFLMTLIKLMEPRTYVELGTHYGASLIGAATASKSFNVPMKLYGIDSWEGDEHAGVYEGDSIYRDLRNYVGHRFKNVELVRAYFDNANDKFKNGSIDILHIDGLHTYEAVKHDFLLWLPKMAADGVILFHDTCVHERGFGVYQLWEEIKKKFVTLSFGHSFGLGVCFLDPLSPRISSIGRVARDENTAQLYTSLVAQIGNILHPRMHYIELQEDGRASEKDAWNQVASLRATVTRLEYEGRPSEQDAWNNVAFLRSQVTELEGKNIAQSQSLKELLAELMFYKQQSVIK